MMIRYGMILLPLALAACGSADEAGNNGAQADQSAVVEAAPDNLEVDPGNTVVPIGNTVSAAPVTALATIPDAFLGRWGMVPGDCDPARADNKGLMTVAADRLGFYESRAVPGNVRRTAAGVLTLDLAFSGEGRTWRQVATLTLLDDGKTLLREAVGGEKGDTPGPQRYSRCPAGGAA